MRTLQPWAEDELTRVHAKDQPRLRHRLTSAARAEATVAELAAHRALRFEGHKGLRYERDLPNAKTPDWYGAGVIAECFSNRSDEHPRRAFRRNIHEKRKKYQHVANQERKPLVLAFVPRPDELWQVKAAAEWWRLLHIQEVWLIVIDTSDTTTLTWKWFTASLNPPRSGLRRVLPRLGPRATSSAQGPPSSPIPTPTQ